MHSGTDETYFWWAWRLEFWPYCLGGDGSFALLESARVLYTAWRSLLPLLLRWAVSCTCHYFNVTTLHKLIGDWLRLWKTRRCRYDVALLRIQTQTSFLLPRPFSPALVFPFLLSTTDRGYNWEGLLEQVAQQLWDVMVPQPLQVKTLRYGSISRFISDHCSGPGRAICPCVCVCVWTITLELNDPWARYRTCWFILPL